MKTCEFCGFRPVPEGFVTCGNSHCQEASFYRCLAKGLRKGSARQQEAVKAADAAELAAKQVLC